MAPAGQSRTVAFCKTRTCVQQRGLRPGLASSPPLAVVERQRQAMRFQSGNFPPCHPKKPGVSDALGPRPDRASAYRSPISALPSAAALHQKRVTRKWKLLSLPLKIDKTFRIAQPMRKVSWTKCFAAGGRSVRGQVGTEGAEGAVGTKGERNQEVDSLPCAQQEESRVRIRFRTRPKESPRLLHVMNAA